MALLLMSLIFYAWGEPKLVFLMIATILVDYTAGRLIAAFSENRNKAKTVLILAILVNLGFLCYFKYANFIIDNLNAVIGGRIDPLHVILPIGISFYTFQSMSYLVDVYRKDVPAERNVLNFAAYVALFPQLVAGPIVQYKTIANELSCRQETAALFAEGVWRFAVGLGKKVLLANQIGVLWTEISGDPGSLTAGKAWIGALAFTFQIYFDFPDIRTWRSVSGKCSDSIFWRISIILMFPKVSRNSGGAGIFRSGPGSVSMCTSRLAGTERDSHGRSLIF